MADPGTDTIDQTAPAAKPSPKPAPVDYDRLKGAFGSAPPTLGQTLAADRADIESKRKELTLPTLTPPPKQQPSTDPLQAFGQPAMFLALFGSLLTRNHLTNAINAAGGVLKATHDLDAAVAKQNYDVWKIESENAMKMVKYTQDSYKLSMEKLRTDSSSGLAEMKVKAEAYRDMVMDQVMQTEGPDGIKKLLFARGHQADATATGLKDFEANIKTQVLKSYFDALATGDPAKMQRAKDLAAGLKLLSSGELPGTKGEEGKWAPFTDTESGKQGYSRIVDGKPQYMNLAGDPMEAPGGLGKVGVPAKPTAVGAALAEDTDRAKIAYEKQTGVPYDEKTATPEQRSAFHDMQDAAVQQRKQNVIATNPGSFMAERKTRFDETKAAMQADGTYKDDAGVWSKTNQDMFLSKTAKLPPGVARMLADQIIAGNWQAAASFGRSPQMLGQLDTALLEAMNEHVPPLTGRDVARAKVEFAAYAQGVKAFEAGGKLEPTIRSLDVVTDHLSTLRDAAEQVAQGEAVPLNRIRNALGLQAGAPGPATFDAIKGIVAAEIEKAVSGGGGAVSDRDDLKENLDKARSPEQLLSVITGYQDLMRGQVNGLRSSYNRVQTLMDLPHRNFDSLFISPRTQAMLGSGAAGNSGGGQPLVPSVLRGKPLQYNANKNQWRDKTTGTIYGADGEAVQ